MAVRRSGTFFSEWTTGSPPLGGRVPLEDRVQVVGVPEECLRQRRQGAVDTVALDRVVLDLGDDGLRHA
jgi:hypothetical protein